MTPHKLTFSKYGETFVASTPFGDYKVLRMRPLTRWACYFGDEGRAFSREHETVELAQKACRLDYIRRFNEAFGFDKRHDAAAVLARTLHYIEKLPPGQQIGEVNWPSLAAELRDIVCQMEAQTV